MKKIIAAGILVIALCTAFKKKGNSITDYRDAYTGSYFCRINCNKIDLSRRNTNINTTDTMSVSVTKDATDSVLQFTFGAQVVKFKLTNKTLKAYPSGGHYGGRFFATDSLDIRFSQTNVSSCGYKGKKK
jgi:hypothetical protein